MMVQNPSPWEAAEGSRRVGGCGRSGKILQTSSRESYGIAGACGFTAYLASPAEEEKQ